MSINNDLVKQIDSVLPQTQCTRCNYPSCFEYAEAIANNEANINQCPPGGDEGIHKLAKLLNREYTPLNPQNGIIKPREVAKIIEEDCIGCTLCIKVCPVDAIIGSNKMLHNIIEADCTGCDLCLPACPVDCIIMEEVDDPSWTIEDANRSRDLFNLHKLRKVRDEEQRLERLRKQAEMLKSLKE